MYRLLDYGVMARDRDRVDAWRRALAAVLHPGSIVLDLGAGIGTFTILACQAGAARVYAVDPSDVITVAEELAKTNGVADRVRFIQQNSNALALPERVDIILADLSGALPMFEEHIPAVMRARASFLKPNGVLVPARDRLFCAPFSSEAIRARLLEPWRSVAGVDFGPAETMALHGAHAMKVTPEDLAGEPQCWAELDYATIQSPNVSGTARWRFDAPKIIHGFALWFESILAPGIQTQSGPWSPESVHATMVLSLAEPKALAEIELRIDATLAAGRYVTTWQVNGAAPQSTFHSELRSKAALEQREGAQPAADAAAGVTFRAAKGVLCRRVGDELLLLDPASGLYYVLNETALKVWESLESGDAGSIAAAVAGEFDIDAARAASDVAAILGQLQEAKLIDRV